MRIKDLSFCINWIFKSCFVTNEKSLQKVLVADDENIICQLMGAILAGFGAVEMAESGQ